MALPLNHSSEYMALVTSQAAKVRAYRFLSPNGRPYFVAQKPGEGGVDWGYDSSIANAAELSPYWRRRFAADMRRVNSQAHFVTVEG